MRVVLILLVLLGISLVLALALSTLVCPISDNLSLRMLPSFPCSTSIVCFKNALSSNRGECWYPRTLPKSPTATYRISGRKQICYWHDSLCQSNQGGDGGNWDDFKIWTLNSWMILLIRCSVDVSQMLENSGLNTQHHFHMLREAYKICRLQGISLKCVNQQDWVHWQLEIL